MPFHSFNSPVAGVRKLCTAVIIRETIIIHLSTLIFAWFWFVTDTCIVSCALYVSVLIKTYLVKCVLDLWPAETWQV